jgi:hypothetical protein
MEMNAEGAPLTILVRHRDAIWFSKFETSAEIVTTGLKTLSFVRFRDSDGPYFTW